MKDKLELPENLLPYQGEVYYLPGFFDQKESDVYMELLLKTIAWRQEPIKIFGKAMMQPRLTAWYGAKDYTYSGITMLAQPFSPPLLEMKQKIEMAAHINFNTALLNLYRNGRDSMGWHRDNEKALGLNAVIASVSFGATRRFQFRNYQDKNVSTGIGLEHGSLLLMRGETQHYWEHALAKTSKVTAPRINITFRSIN